VSYGRAAALVAVAALMSATNGLFVRALGEIGDWQLVFWRHLIMGTTMIAVLAIRQRGALPAAIGRMGGVGALGCLCFGASGVLFMMSLHHAPIADVMFVMAAVPMLTAALAWATLGERVRRSTWLAMAVAMGGIALMVAGSLGGADMAGILFSVGNAFVVAGFATVLRWGRAMDMLPMFALGSLLAALTALVMAAPDLAIDREQALILLAWCGVVAPIYYSMFVIGSRRLPGAELMLSLPFETIAAASLAWLVLGELPAPASLAGGAIVLAAVIGLALVRLRRPEA